LNDGNRVVSVFWDKGTSTRERLEQVFCLHSKRLYITVKKVCWDYLYHRAEHIMTTQMLPFGHFPVMSDGNMPLLFKSVGTVEEYDFTLLPTVFERPFHRQIWPNILSELNNGKQLVL